ncbi:MAG: PAS domain S-box protein [Spirochaetales bacterium]|nr:PAS domain S-box protein [Spirochaetales bacterium]
MQNLIRNPVYQALLRNATRPVCVVDREGIIFDVNEKFSHLTGIHKEKLNTKTFKSLVDSTPENFPGDGGGENVFTTRLKNFENRETWLGSSVVCIDEENGFYFVFLKDITEHILFESGLEYRNKQLNYLTEFAYKLAGLSSEEDLNKTIVECLKEFTGAPLITFSNYDVSESMLQLSRVDTSRAVIRAVMKLGNLRSFKRKVPIPQDKYKIMVEEIVEINDSLTGLTRGAVPEVLSGLITKVSGLTHFAAISYVSSGQLMGTSLLGFTSGQPLPLREHLMTFAHLAAVSLRRRDAEKALLKSRERLRTIIDSFTDILFVLDKNGNIEASNKFSSQLFGYSIKKLKGHSFSEVTGYRKDGAGYKVLKSVFEEGEFRTMTHEQNGKVYRGSFFPIFGEKKRVISAVLHIQDITERRELRERLYQAEKMNTVGQLAGGVAHDFNNQLSGIIGYTELLKTKSKDPTCDRYLDKILSSANNAAVLTRQLLSYAKKGYREDVPIDIHKLLEEVLELVVQTKTEGISVVKSFYAENSIVKGDPNLLQNAFLNLMLNARDAMPDGGRISVITAIRPQSTANGSSSDKPLSNNTLEVLIRDEGMGIPGEILGRIFEPFFTTKKEGEGTGMGLASAYGTIDTHGGKIFVKSKEGSGSDFSVMLPLLKDSFR